MTTACISIAERPSNLGMTMHNAGYKALGLDFVYIPFRVVPENLENAIKGVRAFGIRGCGVSMPHKVNAMKYVDTIDDRAKRIGAINTIVNDDGRLSGYNTDYDGILLSFKEHYNTKDKDVVIIGAGGAARAIILALKDMGTGRITLLNRTDEKARKLSREFSVEHKEWKNLRSIEGDVLINATPVGMPNLDENILVDKQTLKRFETLMDVVINPAGSQVVRDAKELGLITIPGYKIALQQAARQFELYTGNKAPMKAMETAVLDLWGLKK